MGAVASQIHPLADTRLEVSPGVQAAAAEELAEVPPELPPAPTELPPDEPPEFPLDPPLFAGVPPWLPPAGDAAPPVPLSPPDAGGGKAQPPAQSSVRSVQRDSLDIEDLL